jgi:hypothetical protein
LLGFRPLPWSFLVILVGMADTYLGVAEAGKAVFFRRARRGATTEKPQTVPGDAA